MAEVAHAGLASLQLALKISPRSDDELTEGTESQTEGTESHLEAEAEALLAAFAGEE